MGGGGGGGDDDDGGTEYGTDQRNAAGNGDGNGYDVTSMMMMRMMMMKLSVQWNLGLILLYPNTHGRPVYRLLSIKQGAK